MKFARRLDARRERRRRLVRGPVGRQEPAPQGHDRHVRLLPGPVRRVPQPAVPSRPRAERGHRARARARARAELGRQDAIARQGAPPSRGALSLSGATGSHDDASSSAACCSASRSCSGSSSSCSSLARLLPGDPCRRLARRAGDDRDRARPSTTRYGLDQPIPDQFADLPRQPDPGRPGHSRPVRSGRSPSCSSQRLPMTIELTFFALMFATFVGIPLGIVSAVRRNSPDRRRDDGPRQPRRLDPGLRPRACSSRTSSRSCFKGTPFALPPSGRLSPGLDVVPLVEAWGLEDLQGPRGRSSTSSPNMYTLNALRHRPVGRSSCDALRHMILPAIALGTIPLAIIARITRSSLLDVLGLDYIRTARAKGLRERLVVSPPRACATRCCPSSRSSACQLGGLLSGAVLTETDLQPGRRRADGLRGDHGARLRRRSRASRSSSPSIYLVVNLLVDMSYALPRPADPAATDR